jgi:predicted nuclease of predicted toxin-antitoxin system
MKILFDNGTPRPIAQVLADHQVLRARQIGWHELRNGELLQRAEDEGFDVLVTTDRNIRYQQNLASRRIAIVVLSNAQWPNVRLRLAEIAQTISAATPGSYQEVEIPYRDWPRAN